MRPGATRRLALLALLVGLASGCGSQAASTTNAASEVQRWVQAEHLPRQAVRGASIFAAANCTTCHVYAGSGSTKINAPDLTAIGTKHLGIPFEVRHLKCPACVISGSAMPPYRSLGPLALRQLAIFLEASKGTH